MLGGVFGLAQLFVQPPADFRFIAFAGGAGPAVRLPRLTLRRLLLVDAVPGVARAWRACFSAAPRAGGGVRRVVLQAESSWGAGRRSDVSHGLAAA